MKNFGTPVNCTVCGKKLRGTAGIGPGFHVRAHKGLDGKPCWGARRTDHRIHSTATPSQGASQ